MHLGSILPRLASLAYDRVWTRLRPSGYRARFLAAVRRREGLDRDPAETVRGRQLAKLNALLAHASRSVPYWRELAEAGRLPGHVGSLDELADVPILTKDIIRQQRERLLDENYPREQLRDNATGGSTGEPLHFWSDEESLFRSNTGEAWAASLSGLRTGASMGYLWGAGRFERAFRKDLREKLLHLAANQLFVNCFRMTPDDLRLAHRRFTSFAPEGLIGYSSALVELARFLDGNRLRPSYPRRAILSAAETLDDVARAMLERTFGVPVFDRYGSREIGLIATECDRHRGLHVDCENVFVELVDHPDVPGMKRIVVTKLNQFPMPFIRYDMGDLAEGTLGTCDCGRGYPVIPRIVGRVTEMIRLPAGGVLPGELFPHLFKDCGVVTYRVEQAQDYSLDISLVRTDSQTPEQDAHLRRIVADHVGPEVAVNVRYVDEIERSATGKLLPVASRAPVVPVSGQPAQGDELSRLSQDDGHTGPSKGGRR